MSYPHAFPAARTPKGLKVTPSRAYTGPKPDDTVSLMLTERGIIDPAIVEIDECASVDIKVATKVYPLKPTYRTILAHFKRTHSVA